MKNTVLIVDDEKTTRVGLSKVLSDNYRTFQATNGKEALKVLGTNRDIDVVLSDIKMPEIEGIELLEKIKADDREVIVIFMSAFSSIENAVEAMRKGAYDYLTKPIDLNKLEITLKNAIEHKNLKTENILLKQKIKDEHGAKILIGNSPKIKNIMELVQRVSSTKATVLVQGETGTGKELVANILHDNSPVAHGPFIKVNCSALAEGVLESELFGHEKGAFTGALYARKGRFELANSGTLFLDEISDIPPSTQIKLLRFLQDEEFERVGGSVTLKVDVRIISATNKSLEDLVRDDRFRDDLYYRLKVVTIDVPPLRERSEDIPIIINYYLKRFSEIHNKKIKAITPKAMKILNAYDWPGNIRELMNCIESSVVMTNRENIDVESLPSFLFVGREKGKDGKSVGNLHNIEQKAIIDALKKAKGNKALAARQLGIGLRTLYRKLEHYQSE
jgi:DNA-binding NtrC family response regulator